MSEKVWQPTRSEAEQQGIHPAQFEPLLKALKKDGRFGVNETTGLLTYQNGSGEVVPVTAGYAYQGVLRAQYQWAFQPPAPTFDAVLKEPEKFTATEKIAAGLRERERQAAHGQRY